MSRPFCFAVYCFDGYCVALVIFHFAFFWMVATSSFFLMPVPISFWLYLSLLFSISLAKLSLNSTSYD